ncbi:MAG: hypothetical protein SNH88_04660 [Rikenellaceae bacterium]
MKRFFVKILKFLAAIILWLAIAGYFFISQRYAAQDREHNIIDSIAIHIIDSIATGDLISSQVVGEWLDECKIPTIGVRADKVDLYSLREQITSSSFVERANLYTTRQGVLHVDVDGRSAAVRLMVDGYNRYITEDGYVFGVPATSPLYLPVVTGDYQPIFPSDFEGHIDEYLEEQIALIGREIEQIERDKYPILAKERANNELERERRRMRTSRGWFESRESFDKRVAALREKKEDLRRFYRDRGMAYKSQIEQINSRQEAKREQEKKLKKSCEDLHKLITFVKMVDRDPFWRSEVTQIVISEGESGSLRVAIIPRSGSFKVTLGGVEHIDNKLDKLYKFYHSALGRVGWERYKSINIEFKNQVVCK